jgi:hypothetical protein
MLQSHYSQINSSPNLVRNHCKDKYNWTHKYKRAVRKIESNACTPTDDMFMVYWKRLPPNYTPE